MTYVWIRMGQLTIRVHSSHEQVLDAVRDMWGPVVVPEPSGEDVVDTRIEGGPPWRFWMEESPSPETHDPWMLMTYIRSAIDQRVLEGTDSPRIHASAVDLPSGEIVIFPGDAGAGKTTLSLTLVDRGASLLLDDLGVIGPSDSRIQGIPRPIGVRGTIPFDRFRSRWEPPIWMGRPNGNYLVPFHLFSPPPPSFSPTAVVFPRFVPHSGVTISPMPPGELLARLGRHIAPLTGPWMSVVAGLVAGVKGFELVFADPVEAADRLEHVLQGGG